MTAVGTVAVGSSAAEPAATGGAAAERNIVRTAVGAGEFETLTALLKQARLARTLRRGGPFTVFAPTDRAFAKLPKRTLKRLGRDRAALRSVLLHHVVARKLPARKLVKRNSVTTLNGDSLRVRTRGTTVKIDGARVTAANVAASNGVIHVVDEVLVPH